MPKVTLKAEGRLCLIETAAGGVMERLRALTAPRRGLILLDHAFRDEAEALATALPGFKVVFAQKRGEAAKTLDESRRLLEIMNGEKLSRDDWLIVRGGGSLTDLGAFCAGLYKRGLNLILVPTTLLGAVDAAVGGKTAVNFMGAKNQVGHFYLPAHVLVDLDSFQTLGPDRLAEGLVEAYKTGLLFDEALIRLAEEKTEAVLSGQADLLAEAAGRSYAAKAALVVRDFREEKGLRDVLNLGHTYGHVVESFYAPQVSHGRAVAVGLAVAAELSRPRLGARKADRVIETSARLGGPWPELVPAEAALNLLKLDKKIRGGRLRFTLLEDYGRPVVEEIEAEDILRAAAGVMGMVK